MNTSAIIWMVLIQGAVIVITARIFYLVMQPPKNQGSEEEE